MYKKAKTLLCPPRFVYSKLWFFPVVMYGCESWTRKKAKHWIIDAFELWCWRTLLRVPWTTRRYNQSILKVLGVHWKDWHWTWSSNTLATWCKKSTHWKRLWCWARLRIGERGDRRWELDGITNSMLMNLSKLRYIVKDRGIWHAVVYGVAKIQTGQQLNNTWIELCSLNTHMLKP